MNRHLALTLASILCSLPLAAKPAPAEGPAPLLPVPNVAQMKWHSAEQRMFVHFGIKTFHPSSNHMGSGTEDPNTFNPVKFDAKQWVAAAKAGGFEGIVLTCKHHDGFCNWPTDTTPHSVKSSPWKGGKGDIVGELVKACRDGGISFGFYVSIIDHNYRKNHQNSETTYGQFYVRQIRELSTRYGPIGEYWFDGFNAAELKMDYAAVADVIRSEQPDAVVYDSGMLVKHLPDRCLRFPGSHGGVRANPQYRRAIEGSMVWYPDEPSIIFQGNWFHDGKPIKSLKTLEDYYLTSVGYGTTPLMNVSPNSDGLIDPESIVRLKEYKAWIGGLHQSDLTQGEGVGITANETRKGAQASFGPEQVLDHDPSTYAAPADNSRALTLDIDLGSLRKGIKGFILQEPIQLGQRITGYTIQAWADGEWKDVWQGKAIGYKRIVLSGRADARDLRIPATRKLRVKLVAAEASPLLGSFQVIGKVGE